MILIDTTPLVALCDPRDKLHSRAMRDLDRLAHVPLLLCAPVLTEACFLLEHPVQRARLRRLIVELAIRSLVGDDAELWETVFSWLEKYRDHEPDWADGYLVALTSRDDALKVWTYDREFTTTWRRLDGSRVPLGVRLVR
jgi:predicted nucleic acid-binding protein